jgi:hypothetical protein
MLFPLAKIAVLAWFWVRIRWRCFDKLFKALPCMSVMRSFWAALQLAELHTFLPKLKSLFRNMLGATSYSKAGSCQ